MASGNDRLVSCSSSSSLRLLLFMIPLIVISGCASVLGSRNSSWGFISRHPWPWSSPTAATITSVKTPQVPSTKESEGLLDLHSTVVGVHHREEAISEDSVLNRSSSPPLDVEAAQPPPAAALQIIYSLQRNPKKMAHISTCETRKATPKISLRPFSEKQNVLSFKL
ncbi:unnamed protein product, partial [Vitis vinifera]|uniref:Uncharacterized protein n=1 Tax=Vitis vinifera TaxID=29760 RepID=D7TIY6_VITVI